MGSPRFVAFSAANREHTSPENALAGQQALALQTLALQLAIAADRLRPLARPLLRWFFVVAPQFHLAKDAFPLPLLFQRFERLVDIVVANDDLQARLLLLESGAGSYQNPAKLSTFRMPKRLTKSNVPKEP